MRRLGLIFCFAAANLVAVSGCQRHSDYDDAMPETSGYTLELTGDEGNTLSKSSDVGRAQQSLTGEEVVGNTLQRTKDAVDALNAGIHQVLDPLAALVGSANFTVEGEAHVFNFDHGDVHLRFAIVRFLGNHYVWKLDAKPRAEHGAYGSAGAASSLRSRGMNASAATAIAAVTAAATISALSDHNSAARSAPCASPSPQAMAPASTPAVSSRPTGPRSAPYARCHQPCARNSAMGTSAGKR